ncbi:MAG: MFS transporter [Furfurilactobacillus sp.]|jgi:sugar phosphate permease|uniref:MFS transporter n=2 Tax=Furfurilactobacillus TaxID=2767882 RepID=A0ABT6DCX7_9LACO|nr:MULTISPECIES: MFS transporter [Furfurilactobacillus]QLE65401.1 transmembrane efflux protein [Furfurilactobacillus rossiae]MCF6160900.1 MFS transporter [Furfurilactobacillus milii]MCF6163334.1 MFS transporter [Furfurilactobacillus milii]MCH4011920.1 MFS transporter [Furfurilactobacillus sp.]MCH4037812.1 MFS transporter [Furfurilactobacillus sp.]
MATKKRFDWILLVILMSYFMILLDNSIIFTGTVKIAQDLQLNQQTLSWVSSAYSLTFGGFLLLDGRAGDLFGRRRVFQIGLVIFGIGSLLVGLSVNAPMIIASRAFQGIGSAILAPTTLAILMDTYEGPARVRAIAYYGAMAGIGASVSLVIGGVFASLLTWRVGFFINVPISMWMYYLSVRHLQKDGGRSGKLDWIGTLSSLFGMSALVYSIVGTWGKLSALILAIVLLAIFAYQEYRTSQPIMPLRLFKNRERIGAYLGRFLYLGSMLGFWFITPQLMQRQLGFSALMAGVAFFPLTIVNFIVALQVARLTAKFGNGRLLTIGIALPMLVIDIGQGLSLSPFTAAGVAHTDVRDAGAASGVVNVMHQIGGSVGLSILVSVQGLFKNQVIGFHYAILIGAGLLLISLLAAIFLILPEKQK